MNPEIVERYSAPVPRYTSYPTSPHFSADIGHRQYSEWLTALPVRSRLSLYLHIPFCDTLCWYCGCCTKEVHRYEPVAEYLVSLLAEIENVSARLPQTHEVAHIHWGGGSPNVLTAPDILKLAAAVRASFHVRDDAEFAVEIDPRGLTEDRVSAFAQAGVNRVSVGVQDFNTAVQAAINRHQTFETTKKAVDLFRQHGVEAINVDLVYGLPHQTRDSVEETINQVLELAPERIAIFGYAHLPSRLKHQRLIDEASLPGAIERFAQSNRLAHILGNAGYVRIGLDHFARPQDSLASGPVNRNFQGYTTDAASTLIGLGASAIGRLPQGYVQNAAAVGDYARRIQDDGLATARGVFLTQDDLIRGFVIERLMCDMQFPVAELRRRFGSAATPVLEEAEALIGADQDRLIERTAGGFRVTDKGRPFVRTIAACFDSYLGTGPAQHSAGV
ncbi:MAG: oxygen-independent coproporphyrinogen III oxidase [Hyphomicrobium sp.]